MISPTQVSRVAGLFGGMGATPDPAVPADPRQQNAMQAAGVTNPLLQQFGQSVAGLFGKADQMASPMQQMNRAIQSVENPSSYEGKLKIAQAVMQIDPMQGSQLLASAEEAEKARLAHQARKTNLSRQASSLGLPEVAAFILDGGDFKVAEEQILDEQKRQAQNRGGRQARVALARQAGLGSDVINKINKGGFDVMDNDQFNDMIKGVDADLEVYQDSQGVSRPFRTFNGKVWDSATKTWKDPAELSLSQAPTLTKQVGQLDDITKALVGKEVENYNAVNTSAHDALKLYELNQLSEDMLQNDIITGFGGEAKVQALKVVKAFGYNDAEANELIANTETFFAFRARAVAEVIKAFGSGTGLSNADREYAAIMSAAAGNMDRGTIEKLLDLERRVIRKALENNNGVIDRLTEIAGATKGQYDSFYLPIPDGLSGPVGMSQEALDLLNQARNATNTP